MELQPIVDALVKVCAAVLLACAPIIAVYVVKVLKIKVAEVEAKLSTEQLTQLRYIVSIVVRAAEQMGVTGQINDKKQFAIDAVQNWLASRNVYIDVCEISDAVESAVLTEAFPHVEPAKLPPAETHGAARLGDLL